MPRTSKNQQDFATNLLKWHQEKNDRKMPWKGERDPYRIWLSEIILQQTRVEQGLRYYNHFIETYPDVHTLANAPEDQVFKSWEGLGYYSRCRNLIASARKISKERGGRFPETYGEILTLKGVGPYTAAAISSFAFNLPHAVVDGNVFRVLSRIFGISTPIDSTEGKAEFTALANQLLNVKEPALYNQAIMDFGAVICKPVPLCEQCVFRDSCHAFLNSEIQLLPVKEKKIRMRKRWFYYIVLRHGDAVAVRQRNEKDIWQQLFEFPMVELDMEHDPREVTTTLIGKKGMLNETGYELITTSATYKQQLSHQMIIGQFIEIRVKNKPNNADFLWVSPSELKQFAFPRLINHYLEALEELTMANSQ
ncbi:MAG: A/G-specific adenine glycosylase [Chitinophagaceae bacterium]|nr:A/G-specific adenine glycosylase [Chitinophagaceae bacterium]